MEKTVFVNNTLDHGDTDKFESPAADALIPQYIAISSSLWNILEKKSKSTIILVGHVKTEYSRENSRLSNRTNSSKFYQSNVN